MPAFITRSWKSALIAGVAGGLVIGACMVWAAWQHNPQGAFHGSGGVSWGSLLNVGLMWLSVGGALTGGTSLLARWPVGQSATVQRQAA